MVRPAGIEPVVMSLKGGRSILYKAHVLHLALPPLISILKWLAASHLPNGVLLGMLAKESEGLVEFFSQKQDVLNFGR
jgi:hypothetical protein